MSRTDKDSLMNLRQRSKEAAEKDCEMKIDNNFKNQTLKRIRYLVDAYNIGLLGGEIMPEDANPGLETNCSENYIYFSLPMALNYQRNSYKLWEAALLTYQDIDTKCVFSPEDVVLMDEDLLRTKLLKYKLALQPNKHIQIWKSLCNTIQFKWGGDIRNLFQANDYDVLKIKAHMLHNKKDYPFLSGTKIMNYWLYVMSNYTDLELTNKKAISVAPDTHVIQATEKLGLMDYISPEERSKREAVAEIWEEVLSETEFTPIDIHTPLWLWSRSGFKFNIDSIN